MYFIVPVIWLIVLGIWSSIYFSHYSMKKKIILSSISWIILLFILVIFMTNGIPFFYHPENGFFDLPVFILSNILYPIIIGLGVNFIIS